MLATQLTQIASILTTNDAINQLDTIYANPDNTSESIKAAFKEVPKKLRARLGEIFLDRQALGDFRIGDRVIISDDCSYRSLSGFELVIDHTCSPYIACTRPSGTFAPGLLKTDIKKLSKEMNYTFRQRSLIQDKCFAANSMTEALQKASNFWFNSQEVSDYVIDGNSVVTLLSNSKSGNVIGTLYYSA